LNRSSRAVSTLLGAIVVSVLAFAGTVQAQTVGTVVKDIVDVAGKQVPLPPGDFTVLAVDSVSARIKKSGTETERLDLGPVRLVVLGQFKDGRIANVVQIGANLIPYHDGWGMTEDCTRSDLYAAVTQYKSGWDVSCLYLKPQAINGETAAPGGEAMAQFARTSNASVSNFWLVAGLRIANRRDVIDVQYHVDPSSLGVTASAAEAASWAPAVIEQHPSRLAVVKDLAAWAGLMAEPLDQGLNHRLTATSFPDMRNAAAVAPDEARRAAQMASLDKLRDAKAIDDAEYQRQMAIIAASATAVAAGDWTYAQVAGWKAFTYRVVVTTINAGIDYMFIGRPFAAGVLVILQVVVNTTKFFFHEMMWQEMLGIGPLQRDGPNIIEFGRIITASSG
jgi:uncharacterized membrane protein